MHTFGNLKQQHLNDMAGTQTWYATIDTSWKDHTTAIPAPCTATAYNNFGTIPNDRSCAVKYWCQANIQAITII
jgi:hypothetical protein